MGQNKNMKGVVKDPKGFTQEMCRLRWGYIHLLRKVGLPISYDPKVYGKYIKSQRIQQSHDTSQQKSRDKENEHKSSNSMKLIDTTDGVSPPKNPSSLSEKNLAEKYNNYQADSSVAGNISNLKRAKKSYREDDNHTVAFNSNVMKARRTLGNLNHSIHTTEEIKHKTYNIPYENPLLKQPVHQVVGDLSNKHL
jgi:hypothetical protein